jgi:hypothetical protein
MEDIPVGIPSFGVISKDVLGFLDVVGGLISMERGRSLLSNDCWICKEME